MNRVLRDSETQLKGTKLDCEQHSGQMGFFLGACSVRTILYI